MKSKLVFFNRPGVSISQKSLFLLLFAGLLTDGLAALKITRQTASKQAWIVTTNRATLKQTRQTYPFQESGVFISNDFDGARINKVVQNSPTHYTISILPENHPINDSPWYAFKIWAASNQTVQVQLAYEQGKHRYPPKISRDGQRWERLPNSDCSTSGDGKSATITLSIGPQPLQVAAQEMFSSQDFKCWIDKLGQKAFVHSRILGHSPLGKPIYALDLTEAGPEARYLLVLGRQHPPELTGTFALQAFTEALCTDTPLARKFRQEFKVVVVPLVNPDGVDAGHWRHNVNGVDLNRDWGQFHQVETRAIRDEFLKIQQTAPGKIRFGIDFHSTDHDVIYAASSQNASPTPTTRSAPSSAKTENFTQRWFQRLQELVPDYNVTVEESPHRTKGGTLTSIGWMRDVLNIPAITYEVGDCTDRQLIQKVATQGGIALMELLLENP